MKNRFVIPAVLVIIALLFVALKYFNLGGVSDVTAEVKEGFFKPAPDFALLDIDGNEKKLSDFKGKVIILDFWATWCPPCRAEIPHFIELYSHYKNQGLEIIGIALDQNGRKVVGPFAEKNNINYPILLAEREISGLYGGISAIPTTFIIDRDGRIRKKYTGYRSKEIFEKDIQELL
ncbi:redoxin domain-containing protein [Candidatus Omnitrophota bacterium]